MTWITGEFTGQVGLFRAVQRHGIIFHLLGGSTPERCLGDPAGDVAR